MCREVAGQGTVRMAVNSLPGPAVLMMSKSPQRNEKTWEIILIKAALAHTIDQAI